ncbi:MAG: flagellar hook-associated protein FlgK [Pseudomonadota bacterium]
MVSFTSKILSSSESGMTAQQALLANASNNIANVNTPGYSRREVDILARIDPVTVDGVLRIGSGVQLGEIRRITNTFLENSLRASGAKQGKASVRNEYLGRVESIFSLSGPQVTVGSALNSFFSSINQVALNPADIDLRLDIMQRGEELVTAIRGAYQEIADTQTELDQRIAQDIDSINATTRDLATLNSGIAQKEATGVSAADERDQRDILLGKLAEKVSFKTLELPNGMINCYLDNGFPLVSEATARRLEVTTNPSFATGPLPPSLNGGILSYVTFNFGSDAAPAHLDLTQTLKNGEGSIAGALQLRGYADTSNTSAFEADGELVQMAARIEAIARTLLTSVNQEYLGPDEDPSTAVHEPSAGDLNGNPPSVFGLFDFAFSGTKDADGNGLPSLTDLTSTGIDSFARILSLGFSQPEQFAAGRDSNPTAGVRTIAPGDGRNAQAIAAMRTQTQSFMAGSLTFTGTFDEMYNSSVSTVGSLKSSAQSEYDVARQAFTVTSVKRDEFSSVSLDEEFANVIKFQKAFQASARMIRTAADLLEMITRLL